MNLHIRAHEFGPARPRLRVWTDEMQPYGQFNVASHTDVDVFVTLGMKLMVLNVHVHHCDKDDECCVSDPTCGICHTMSFGEQLEDYV